MAYLSYLKIGLVVVAIFEIISLFYFLYIYNKFVSNPENYFKNYLTKYAQEEARGN